MSSLELPAGKTSAFVISFDFDAEEVWLAENPENVNRPGVLSQGTYGAKVGLGLVLDTLDTLGLPATFFTPGRVAQRQPARCDRDRRCAVTQPRRALGVARALESRARR